MNVETGMLELATGTLAVAANGGVVVSVIVSTRGRGEEGRRSEEDDLN